LLFFVTGVLWAGATSTQSLTALCCDDFSRVFIDNVFGDGFLGRFTELMRCLERSDKRQNNDASDSQEYTNEQSIIRQH
jgi:hypothetical protein